MPWRPIRPVSSRTGWGVGACSRGTAFGIFNLAAGFAMLAASVLAGALWDLYGPTATFLAGAAFTAVAMVGLLVVQRRVNPHPTA